MRSAIIGGAGFVLGAAVSFAVATEIQNPQATSAPAVRMSTTVTGQPIEVVAHPDLLVTTTTIPVNGDTPIHKHPYQRFVYVLAGKLRVTEPDTGHTHDFNAGDFLPEMRDTWHFGANMGEVPVKLLVIDQVPAGTKSNMVMKGQ